MQKLMHYIVYRWGMFAADRSFDIALSATGASAFSTNIAIVSAKFRRYANTSQCYMGVITALLGRHTCPVELFL